MGAVVALRGRPRVRVDVERVVGTRLHARLTADAAVAVEVEDAVGAAVERDRRAERHARGAVAVVAAEHGEGAPRVRESPPFDVLDPGAEDAEGHLVLLFARHGARVTADAAALVDHEAVAHAASLRVSATGDPPRPCPRSWRRRRRQPQGARATARPDSPR